MKYIIILFENIILVYTLIKYKPKIITYLRLSNYKKFKKIKKKIEKKRKEIMTKGLKFKDVISRIIWFLSIIVMIHNIIELIEIIINIINNNITEINLEENLKEKTLYEYLIIIFENIILVFQIIKKVPKILNMRFKKIKKKIEKKRKEIMTNGLKFKDVIWLMASTVLINNIKKLIEFIF